MTEPGEKKLPAPQPWSSLNINIFFFIYYNVYFFLTGDIINIHEKQPDGWWIGEVEGNVGIFPATYVEEID